MAVIFNELHIFWMCYTKQKMMDTAVKRKDLGSPVGDTIFGKRVCLLCMSYLFLSLYMESISFVL